MRQIFLDTETTGLSPEKGDRVIEIAAVAYDNRMPVSAEDGGVFHTYVNPQRAIHEDAQRVHGLSREFLADKPLFADVAAGLLDFLRDSEIIIHNAPFDCGFLNSELTRIGQPLLEKTVAKITCSLDWSRKNNHSSGHSLDALCMRFDIDNSARESGHNALLDVQLLAKVYLSMTSRQAEITLRPKRKAIAFQGSEVLVLRADEAENAAHRQVLEDMQANGKKPPLFLQHSTD